MFSVDLFYRNFVTIMGGYDYRVFIIFGCFGYVNPKNPIYGVGTFLDTRWCGAMGG